MRFDTLFDTPFSVSVENTQKHEPLFYAGLSRYGTLQIAGKQFYIFQVLEEK